MIFTLLQGIKKHLISAILVSTILGLIVGYYVDVTILKKTITPLTFMLVYPMMVSLNLASLKQKMNVKLQLTTQLINFIVFPIAAYVIGVVFFNNEPMLRLGLLIMALLPTSGMTISWTVMGKGNVQSAIRMVVIGLLLGAVLSPFYITFLLGESIEVPFMKIASSILVVVFIPLFIAYLTQVILIKQYGKETFHQTIKPKFPLFSILGVVLIIFVAISLKATLLINNPSIVLQMILPLILFYAITLFVPLIIGKKFFSKEDAIALSNGTLVRNLSVALSIVLGAFEGAGIAALLIAIAYVIQVQLAAWNARLAQKIY